MPYTRVRHGMQTRLGRYPDSVIRLLEKEAKTDIDAIRRIYQTAYRGRSRVQVSSRLQDDGWKTHCSTFTEWDKAILCGRDYLVGQHVPLTEFVRSHTRSMNLWQRLAYIWIKHHADHILYVESNRSAWQVYVRGEYVELALPHHGKGGEKNSISRDGRRMVLVNVD